MSNIITPLTSVDFTASIAELKSHLEVRIVAMPAPKPWSDIYYFMVPGDLLPETSNTLAELNLSILNVLYIETQGGNEYYQGTTPNSYIIFPLEETESTLSAYSAPIGSAGIPDDPNGYNAEDCTLLENYSLSEPLFVKCVLDDAEPVYYYQIPEGEVFKSIIVFVNEDTL
jgi:hypothetical protein